MGRYQIVEKLEEFLLGDSVNAEARAVYLLVEIRKILDHGYNKKTDYLLLRFYCDWVVHTEKTKNLGHIAPLVQEAFDGIKAQIEGGPCLLSKRLPIVRFIYMDALRNEMKSLFKKEGLPLALFQRKHWVGFVAAVVQVLTGQPILNPIPEVPRLELTPANSGCVCGVMYFAQPITGYDGKKYPHYNFGNAY